MPILNYTTSVDVNSRARRNKLSELNYTKGEWEAGVGHLISLGEHVSYEKHICVGLKSNPHKIIAATGLAEAEDESESIANAQLISAAPEMYEALKMIMEWVESGHINDEAKQTAYAALSKAEGKL